MTYSFSKKSLERLSQVHPVLVAVVKDVMDMQIMDFTVTEGVRDKARQKELFGKGFTKTLQSKHLIQEDGYGHAVDLYPCPIDLERVVQKDPREIFRFGVLAGLMLAAAQKRGILIVNGADWDRDGQTLDHTFFDAPHFQLS